MERIDYSRLAVGHQKKTTTIKEKFYFKNLFIKILIYFNQHFKKLWFPLCRTLNLLGGKSE